MTETTQSAAEAKPQGANVQPSRHSATGARQKCPACGEWRTTPANTETKPMEIIEWFPPDQPPDDETTVLLNLGGEVWPGWRKAGRWYEADARYDRIADTVLEWAHMPTGSRNSSVQRDAT